MRGRRKLYSGDLTGPMHDAWEIARACVDDVMEHGGTLVLVAGPDKVTLVQRAEAEPLE